MPNRLSGKHKFTEEEDQWIYAQVKVFGTDAWAAIAKMSRNRTCRQLRERWRHYLRPGVVSTVWRPEEDQVLIEEYTRIGPRWSAMREALPGRSDASIRNRFALICRRGWISKELKLAKRASTPVGQKANSEDGPRPFPTLQERAPWERNLDCREEFVALAE